MSTSNSIRRVELTPNFLRIYFSFPKHYDLLKKRKFQIVIREDLNDKNKIFTGKIPRKSDFLELINDNNGQEVCTVEYSGDKCAGEIFIPLEKIKPFNQLFVRLEKENREYDITEWISNIPQLDQEKKKIYERTLALIPCYNSAKHISQVALETLDFVKRLIIVDDGSTDGSGEIIHQIKSKYPEKIQVIKFDSNQGKGFALLAGFKEALKAKDFSFLVTLDADSQHRPSDIPYLAEGVFAGNDLVIGSRLFRLMPARSRIFNGIISFLLKGIYGTAPKDTQSGMRAFNCNFLKLVTEKVGGGCYEMEFKVLLLALSEKRKILSLPISTIYIDKNISSHYSPIKDSLKIGYVFFKHLFSCNCSSRKRRE